MRISEAAAGIDTSLGDELVASLTEGMAILRGEVKPVRFYPALATTNGCQTILASGSRSAQ